MFEQTQAQREIWKLIEAPALACNVTPFIGTKTSIDDQTNEDGGGTQKEDLRTSHALRARLSAVQTRRGKWNGRFPLA